MKGNFSSNELLHRIKSKQIPTPGNHMKRISDMMIKRRHIRQTACYGVQQSKRIGADSLNRDYQAQGAIEGVRSQ